MSWHGDCRKGPPLILQSDNGREFLNLVARSGSNNDGDFTEAVVARVHHVFGQVPRVGLQSPRLSHDLANSLTTEADLNAALGLPHDKAIDDDSPAAFEPRRMQQPRPLMAKQVPQVNLMRMGGWHRGSAALALATRKIGTH
eukprot:jgi/Tetstr1/432862/TSEL_022211.t1